MSSNLKPGQYQIGNVVFGRHTIYPVTTVEIQAANTTALDYQGVRADEVNFGQDNFVPQPVIFTMGVLDNKILPNMVSLTDYDPAKINNIENAHKYALHNLAREWRGDDVRSQWGASKFLKCCERDGRVLFWYGRPRKFQYSRRSAKSEFFTVQAEYIRGDTLNHTDDEYGIELAVGQTKPLTRVNGDMPAWFRILIYGPANDTIINGLTEHITGDPIQLDYNIPAGVVVEISSYPWSRRVVDTNNINHAARLIGESRYLDQFRIPAFSTRNVSWSAGSTTGASKIIVAWRDAYSAMA